MNSIDDRAAPRFISLRTKLIGFISLIIFVICSVLGLYFIQQRAEIMDRSLVDRGTILAKNLAYNSRTHVFIENLEELQKLIDGVMEVEEVAYVVITGPEGKRLAAKSKGLLEDRDRLMRVPEAPLYPSPELARAAMADVGGEPIITPFSIGMKGARNVLVSRGKSGFFFVPGNVESLDDFAAPVLRRKLPQSVLPPFLVEPAEPPSSSKVYGVVQVGLTRAKMLATLNGLIRQAFLITGLIILCGIALTILLARHIITPLKSLAEVAERIAAGDLSATVKPTTDDEVGHLTTVFNRMAESLKQREEDITRAYRQLEQLTQSLEQRVRERTAELEVANARLRELDELKSAFVSTVSHELRTPMTSIKGYVENILDGLTGGLTEKQSYYLSRVKFNVERLTRMINDLLDLSRIEAGRVEMRLGTVCMRDLASEVVEGFQTIAKEKEITLRTHHAEELPAIQGDRDKLNQVLTNLIQNAIKFTPKGGEVLVESNVYVDGSVQISVSDTGCGIPSHELDRVFDRFYRGESISTADRGTGLGLPIAKSLVELHGGRIWAESVPGQGSRFFFTVPIESSPRVRP